MQPQLSARILDRRRFPAGAMIFAEGEQATSAYILLRGDVTILTGLGTPHQRVIAQVEPGQMFGAHALLADVLRISSARSQHGCDLIFVSEVELKRKLDEADPFMRRWVHYLSKRVVDLLAQ
jgi:CRP/FNR family transcriptional regulator, cyclic AMP receptor protein